MDVCMPLQWSKYSPNSYAKLKASFFPAKNVRRTCEITPLEVRYAQIKALGAILISSPLEYVFYTFFKYTATYSSSLNTWLLFPCSGWTCSGRELGFPGYTLNNIQDICLISHSLEGVWKNESGRCWRGKGSFADAFSRSRFYSWLYHRGSSVVLGKYQGS